GVMALLKQTLHTSYTVFVDGNGGIRKLPFELKWFVAVLFGGAVKGYFHKSFCLSPIPTAQCGYLELPLEGLHEVFCHRAFAGTPYGQVADHNNRLIESGAFYPSPIVTSVADPNDNAI